MKNSHFIVSNLSRQYAWQPLKRHICYRNFLRLLTKRLKESIAFIYIKNDTLFVAVKHPGLKMEIDCNKDLLKSILTSFSQMAPECDIPIVKKVVAFHTKYHPIKELVLKTHPFYGELAKGDFNFHLTNPSLQETFSKIREIIRCNQ